MDDRKINENYIISFCKLIPSNFAYLQNAYRAFCQCNFLPARHFAYRYYACVVILKVAKLSSTGRSMNRIGKILPLTGFSNHQHLKYGKEFQIGKQPYVLRQKKCNRFPAL